MSTLDPEEADWLTFYEAWSQMMFHEAAERGYIHAAAREATDRYFEAKRAYASTRRITWFEDLTRAANLYAKRRAV
jgi:hypothetical protein